METISSEHIEVYVNDRKVDIYRGMKVKNAVIAYDPKVYAAALAGEVRIMDENGFSIDLEGGLSDGAKIYTAAIV